MALSSPAEVKALVPDVIFKRAKEVVSSSKLHDISFKGPSFQHSSATCTGSNPGDSYSLSVLVNAESSSNPMCQCSCPAAPKTKGNLCKHVIALLLLRIKELEKVVKDQSNAALLSEFKLAEDRLSEGRQRDLTVSDSQATEVFVPSDDMVDNDISTTASSISPVMKNNQKRVLPSWISEGYCASKKEVKEKKGARKASGKDVAVKEEAKMCTTVDGNGTSQTGRGKGKSRLLGEGRSTKSFVKKQRDDAETERVQVMRSEAEDCPSEFEQEMSSRALRGSTQKKATTSFKNGHPPAQKRRRTRVYVESDLSEEEEPKVLDDECSFEAKKDIALTTEDLINLATEHLTRNKNEPRQNQEAETIVNDEPQKNTVASKKKSTIFSVQGWNEIATKGLDGKDASYSQETSQLPSNFLGDINNCHSQAGAELGIYSPHVCGDTTKSLGAAENVVDDMLGLLFGPTLSKTVNSRLESSQNLVQDVNKSAVDLLDVELLEDVLPVSNDSAPQPKKKSSLKDKVMMYLG